MSDVSTLAPTHPAPAIRELAEQYNASARPGRRAHVAHLSLVYSRGAVAAPQLAHAHAYGLARVHAFLTLLASGAMPVNPIAPDRDLLPPHHPLSLRAPVPERPAPGPLVASTIIDALGRPWKSFLHPRDKNGQFIPTFGNVQLFGRGSSGVSDKHYATGRYVGANPDGSIQVRLNAVNDPNQKDQIGRVVTMPADQVATMSSPGGRRQKASIGGHMPTSLDEDSIEYRNQATKDAFDEGLARLGDKNTPGVNANGTAFSEGDRITTQVHSDANGQDEIESRNGTIRKIATTKDGTPNALIEFDGEPDQENPDGTPEYSIIDLNAPGVAKSDSQLPTPGPEDDVRAKARLFRRGAKAEPEDPTDALIRGTQERLDRNQPFNKPIGSDLPQHIKDILFRPATPAPAAGPNAPYNPADVRNRAMPNPQGPPSPDIADINKESRTVGVDRPAAPRLEGHEQVGERTTAPNSRGESFGIGDVVQVVEAKRGRKSGAIGQLGIVGNINYKKGGARLYFQDENGEWYQTKGFFKYESLTSIAEGDVDYLAFMRNAHDARGRGLLPSFKRIAPLQPKGSDTATDKRIAIGADGQIMRKGDHVAGVRGSDGTVVQGIVQNINPRGDVIEVIPYGGGDKIAISPNRLRWVRNASSAYTGGDREDVFIDKNMDHGAAAPDRESLEDVLIAAGYSQETQDAVRDAAPQDIGDILRADPAHEQLARRLAAIEALADDDPARHSSQNRADRMYGSVVRAGEAGRLSGETIPRKPSDNQVSRESAADEFESHFPEPEPGPQAESTPEPEPAPSEEGLPEPPAPAPTPEPAPAAPEAEPTPEPAPVPEPTPEVAEPEAAPEVTPTPEPVAPEAPTTPEPGAPEAPSWVENPVTPPEPAPEAPAAPPTPAPAAPAAPVAMTPVARAGQAYRAMATRYKQHPNSDVQAFGRDLEAIANKFDEVEALRASGQNDKAAEKLRMMGLFMQEVRRKNRLGFQRMAGPGMKPEDRALVSRRFMPLLKNTDNIIAGGDRALTPDENTGFFDPNAPASVRDRAAATPSTPELPATDVRNPASAPGGGGSLADQAADLPNPSEVSPEEMDAAYRELMDAVTADPNLTRPQKTAINGALTRGRRAIEKAYDADRSDSERENLLNAAADRINGLAAKHQGTDVGDALEAVAGRLESMADDLPTEALPTPPAPRPRPAPGGRILPRPRAPRAPTPAPAPETTPEPAPPPAPEPPTPEVTPPAGTGEWDFGEFDPELQNPIPGTPAETKPEEGLAGDLVRSLGEPIEGDFADDSERHKALATRAIAQVDALFDSPGVGHDVGNLRSTIASTLKANGFGDQSDSMTSLLIRQWAADQGTKQMQADGLELHSDPTTQEMIGRVYSELVDPSGDMSLIQFGMSLFAGSDNPDEQRRLGESARGMAQLLEANLPQSKWRDERIAYYQGLFDTVDGGGKVETVDPPQMVLPDEIKYKPSGKPDVYDTGNGASILISNGNGFDMGVLATPEDQLSGKGPWGKPLVEHKGQKYTMIGSVPGPPSAQKRYKEYVAASPDLTSERARRAETGANQLTDGRRFAPGEANWHEVDAAEYDLARKDQAYATLAEQMAPFAGDSEATRRAIEDKLRGYLNAQNMDPDTVLLPTARVVRNGNVNIELGQDTLDLWGADADKNIALLQGKLDELMAIRGVHDKPVSIRVSNDVFNLDTQRHPENAIDNITTLAWAVTGDHSISMKAEFRVGQVDNPGQPVMMNQVNKPGGKHFSQSVGGKNTALTALSHEWGHLTDMADHGLRAHRIGHQNEADNHNLDMKDVPVPPGMDSTAIQQDDGSLEWYDYAKIFELAQVSDPTLSGYAKDSPRELRAEQFAEWIESNGQTDSTTVKFLYGSDQDRKDTVSLWFKDSPTKIDRGARARREELIAQGVPEKDASWQAFREVYGSYNRSVETHGFAYTSLVGIAGDQDYYKRVNGVDPLNRASVPAAPDVGVPGEVAPAAPAAAPAGEVAA